MPGRELKILFALLAKRLSKKFYSILGPGIQERLCTRLMLNSEWYKAERNIMEEELWLAKLSLILK